MNCGKAFCLLVVRQNGNLNENSQSGRAICRARSSTDTIHGDGERFNILCRISGQIIIIIDSPDKVNNWTATIKNRADREVSWNFNVDFAGVLHIKCVYWNEAANVFIFIYAFRFYCENSTASHRNQRMGSENNSTNNCSTRNGILCRGGIVYDVKILLTIALEITNDNDSIFKSPRTLILMFHYWVPRALPKHTHQSNHQRVLNRTVSWLEWWANLNPIGYRLCRAQTENIQISHGNLKLSTCNLTTDSGFAKSHVGPCTSEKGCGKKNAFEGNLTNYSKFDLNEITRVILVVLKMRSLVVKKHFK